MDFDFSGYSFYLHPGAYDMRSGIWSLLSGIERMGLDIHSKTVFMFCSRSRQVMRAVVWHDGYWLLQKSLGRGAFRWPDTREEAERLGYYLDRREELRRFLDYPFVTSSNQKAENAIRPFVVGRKGFLFCITDQGAKVSALYYSIIETCKAKGINALEYLTHLFMNAGSIKDGDRDAWRAILPGRCDLSDAREHLRLVAGAKPDAARTEPYVLRGKRR